MTSNLAPPDADILARGENMALDAATGAWRCLALANNALEEARAYQHFAHRLARVEGRTDAYHPEMTECSKEGERRQRMVCRYQEMATKQATVSIEMIQKAVWFKQVFQDSGGAASGAKDVEVEQDDSPIARMEALQEKAREKSEALTPVRRSFIKRRQDDLLKQAEAVLTSAEK